MPTNKQRREAARRHLERQLERRQEREAARRRITLIASIVGSILLIAVVVGVIVAVGNDSKKKTTAAAPTSLAPSATTPTSAAPKVPGTCVFSPAGAAAKKAALPPAKVPTTGTVTVAVATTQGNMTFTLNRAAAPCTVASFVSLVQQKYYNATPCHRLVTSGIYVLQCGDPTGTGSGGPGYAVPDEATGKETYPAGTIAMARTSAPNSGGSQFFIVYKDSPNLMQHLGALQYTVFGKVSSGLTVVDKVAAAGATTGTDGPPKLPIKITSAVVVK